MADPGPEAVITAAAGAGGKSQVPRGTSSLAGGALGKRSGSVPAGGGLHARPHVVQSLSHSYRSRPCIACILAARYVTGPFFSMRGSAAAAGGAEGALVRMPGLSVPTPPTPNALRPVRSALRNRNRRNRPPPLSPAPPRTRIEDEGSPVPPAPICCLDIFPLVSLMKCALQCGPLVLRRPEVHGACPRFGVWSHCTSSKECLKSARCVQCWHNVCPV